MYQRDKTRYKMGKRKGAIITIDLFLSITLFIVAILLVFRYLNTLNPTMSDKDMDQLILAINSPGIPNDWNTSNVILPGLIDDGKLNTSKWNSLITLNYSLAKSLIGINNDFFIYLHNSSSSIMINNTCGYGDPRVMAFNCSPLIGINGLNPSFIDHQDIVINMDSRLIYLSLYVWRD